MDTVRQPSPTPSRAPIGRERGTVEISSTTDPVAAHAAAAGDYVEVVGPASAMAAQQAYLGVHTPPSREQRELYGFFERDKFGDKENLEQFVAHLNTKGYSESRLEAFFDDSGPHTQAYRRLMGREFPYKLTYNAHSNRWSLRTVEAPGSRYLKMEIESTSKAVTDAVKELHDQGRSSFWTLHVACEYFNSLISTIMPDCSGTEVDAYLSHTRHPQLAQLHQDMQLLRDQRPNIQLAVDEDGSFYHHVQLDGIDGSPEEIIDNIDSILNKIEVLIEDETDLFKEHRGFHSRIMDTQAAADILKVEGDKEFDPDPNFPSLKVGDLTFDLSDLTDLAELLNKEVINDDDEAIPGQEDLFSFERLTTLLGPLYGKIFKVITDSENEIYLHYDAEAKCWNAKSKIAIAED